MCRVKIQLINTVSIFLLLIASSLVIAEPKNLIIGKVSALQTQQEYVELKRKLEPISKLMVDEGVTGSEVLLAKTIDEMVKAINTAKVNWVSGSLFMALILAVKTRSEIFVRKDAVENMYSTVFITNKNSLVKSIENLEKKIILFEDSRSSSTYFIPFYELTNYGYTPREYGKTDAAVLSEQNRIYYRFEPERDKMLQALLNNVLNIGVMRDVDYDSLNDELKKKLKIIYQTVKYPSVLEIITPDQDLDIKIKLKKLLKQDLLVNIKADKNKVTERRFENFIAMGKDGFVFLKSIIEHNVVPMRFEKTNKN